MDTCYNPEKQREITVSTRNYLLNDKYYLINFDDWDEVIRDWLADREEIRLTAEHLRVVSFLRQTFGQTKKHPVLRIITAELARKFGKEKGTVKYFHMLFPGGIHQAYLIAGIPMQDSCC